MVSINKVQLLGNLTREPEIKETANGKLARLSLATNRRYRDRDGQMQDATQYHDIVVFQERLVEVIESYCEKGTQIFVEGALEHRSYDDRDGNKKYVSEVVIRPYGGELQLGNRAQGGEGGGDDRGSGNRGGGNRGGGGRDNNRNSRDDDRGGSRGGNDSRGGGRNYDDMDDDIPF